MAEEPERADESRQPHTVGSPVQKSFGCWEGLYKENV